MCWLLRISKICDSFPFTNLESQCANSNEYKSAINQTIAIKIIRKLGFPVSAVWNGREALEYLRKSSRDDDAGTEDKSARPDIILMDVQMPVMDGYEATQILRGEKEYVVLEESSTSEHKEDKGKARDNSEKVSMKALRDLPIIAITASAIQGDNEKCRAAGMDDYLPKPVDKDKLEEMLVKWARKVRR
jgi:CheY-like chemotaxis protein